jgi:hypothetical protein
MGNSILKPEMTSTSSTLSPDDNIVAIIKNATEGLPSSCFNYLSKRVLPACKNNALTICDYISSLRSEVNPSYSYRRDIIILLCSLSIFFKNTKPYKEITREDLISFLDSYRMLIMRLWKARSKKTTKLVLLKIQSVQFSHKYRR